MIIWFGFDDTGTIRSIETHANGWNPGFDFATAPETAHTVALRKKQGITKFVAYDCPCPRTASPDACNCHNARIQDSYVEGGVVRQKPATSVTVNSAFTFTRGRNEVRVPAGSVTLTITGLPEGESAKISVYRKLASIVELPVVVSQRAASATVQLPDEATWVTVSGRLMRPVSILLIPA